MKHLKSGILRARWLLPALLMLACGLLIGGVREVKAATPFVFNATAFPDDTFRKYLKDKFLFVEGETYYESDTIRAGVKVIDISSMEYSGITSLQGIGFFQNLETLNVFDQSNLTSVGLGNNKNLKTVELLGNCLSSVNVSGLTNLETLQVGDNKLTSLDLTSNTKLKKLICYNNNLTSLNVTKNTALEQLSCQDNSLSSLNIDNNPKLKSLDCSFNSNSFTELSIVNNPFLKEVVVGEVGYKSGTVKGFGKPSDGYDLQVNANTEIFVGTNMTPVNMLTFPDEKLRAMMLTAAYSGGDQILNQTEKNSLTQLNCSGKEVASLEGIQVFQNLETINCANCKLTSFNPGAISAAKLKFLNLNGNTSLNTLNVTAYTNLQELNCSGDHLTSLNVTNNAALKKLDCSENTGLGTLNVSKNTDLEELDCVNCGLTSLDVSKNKDLTALYAHDNNLKSLDVSVNTKLNTLTCQNNQITTLDISKASALVDTWEKGDKTEFNGATAVLHLLKKSGVEVGRLSYDKAIKLITGKEESGSGSGSGSGGSGSGSGSSGSGSGSGSGGSSSGESGSGSGDVSTGETGAQEDTGSTGVEDEGAGESDVGAEEMEGLVHSWDPKRPEQEVSPENPVKYITVRNQVLAAKNEKDLKISSFSLLRAKGAPVGRKSIRLKWAAVPNAAKYVVYGSPCGTRQNYKRLKTTTARSFTWKKGKTGGKYYKFIIVAVNAKKKALAASKVVHVATNGGKYGNAADIKLKTTKKKLTVKYKKFVTLKASVVRNGVPVRKHRTYGVMYESDNISVATVNQKGKIKGVGRGTCYIYAYAQNGVFRRIKVQVK
ncbi:MAG: hypothetical protein IJ860_08530 [Eubacterium sp.]|nr:hypothetical protein [Eubacterium sp.]